MKVVLDTSAIIYLNDFRMFEETITVEDVVKEVRDRISTMRLTSLNLKTIQPYRKTTEEIKNTAEETGDLEKLSKTDLEVLALAKESGYTIISDDRNIQNVAEKLGINYVSIFNKKITKLIKWKKFCKNCKKYFEKEKFCPTCGERLIRVPVESKEIVKI
jgi:UPF0271 protein